MRGESSVTVAVTRQCRFCGGPECGLRAGGRMDWLGWRRGGRVRSGIEPSHCPSPCEDQLISRDEEIMIAGNAADGIRVHVEVHAPQPRWRRDIDT
jgi:hypothetical protein